MLGQPKFDTKNLSVELRSREKHDEVSLSPSPQQQQQKKKKKITWTRIVRTELGSNIHENTSNNEGGKRIFLQMGDLSEFPCKKK